MSRVNLSIGLMTNACADILMIHINAHVKAGESFDVFMGEDKLRVIKT